MPEDFIRCLIQAAIELFPINVAKKAELLQNIMGQTDTEEEE